MEQWENTEALKLVRSMDKYPNKFYIDQSGNVVQEKPVEEKPVEEKSPPHTFFLATGGKRRHRP